MSLSGSLYICQDCHTHNLSFPILYLKDIPAFQDAEYLQYITDDVFFVMRKEEHVNPKGKEKIAELYSRSVQMMESLAAGTAEPEVEE